MNKELNQLLERHRFPLTIAKIVVFARRRCFILIVYLARSRAIKIYLKTHQIRKLQIGAGANILEGWLNTDVYPSSCRVAFLNATKRFPFKDSTFDFIYSEHQIEHLAYQEGMFMLRECYRVLKPGGRIRIATPDLQTVIGLYASQKSELQRKYIKWVVDNFLPEIDIHSDVFVINYAISGWEHKFVYDAETLRNTLENARFIDITCHKPGESNDKELQGIESHGKFIGNEDINRFETMVLEAKKLF